MDPTSSTQQEQENILEHALKAYYQQLTPFEQQTCDIARNHLGSSFDLARSNGFIRFMKTYKP